MYMVVAKENNGRIAYLDDGTRSSFLNLGLALAGKQDEELQQQGTQIRPGDRPWYRRLQILRVKVAGNIIRGAVKRRGWGWKMLTMNNSPHGRAYFSSSVG